jgi:peptide/nickel transport system permease protein
VSVVREEPRAARVVTRGPTYSQRSLFWRRFRGDPAAVLGLVLILVIVVCAALAGVVAQLVGHGSDQVLTGSLNGFGLPKGPASGLWFGADSQGRDLLVRVFYGARTSLEIGVGATALAVCFGTIVGVVAGYFGGAVDTVLSRLTDVFLALPMLLIAIGVSSACSTTSQGCIRGTIKPGVLLIVVLVAVFSWPYIARIVRSNVLTLREQEFISAARLSGGGPSWVIAQEILPNVVAPIIIYSTLLIPNNIIFEATLSFLGVGVPDQTASWGGMLRDASGLFDVAWWFMFFPGLFLVATTLAFNLVGDGLRDALDPRSKR